jgi:probable F420-dependent oxidoreductase
VKVDALLTGPIRAVSSEARRLESAGYSGLWVGESKHDPFLHALRAGEATEEVLVGTSVAIAFGRSPLTVASTAYDLNSYLDGRFVLGLGSQVRSHIERRYSMPWSRPAARMREFIAAVRAIWTTWESGVPLDFRGEFYNHTLMTSFFTPDRTEVGAPDIVLAGVGGAMTEVAGEVCDGFVFHPFTTRTYFDLVSMPALERGRTAAGASSDLADFSITGAVFVCTGSSEAELAETVRETRERIAFYASTPGYRGVLDCHGWGELQPELASRLGSGRWIGIGDLISDEVLAEFAIVGSPNAVATELQNRWGSTASRVALEAPACTSVSALAAVVRESRTAS